MTGPETDSTCTFNVPGRTTAVFLKARPATEQILLLKKGVETLVTSGVLNAGQGNALLVKLRAAERQIGLGRIPTAVNQINAFIHQVEAFQTAGILSEDQAWGLLDDAEGILEALGV